VAELSRQFSRSQEPVADYGTPPGLLGQLLRFGVVGGVSTGLFLMLFLALRSSLGSQCANAAALALSALANTYFNRRFTFGITGRRKLATHQIQGLTIFCLGLLLTSVALAAVHRLNPSGGRTLEIAALFVANGAAMLARFLLFRRWVFRPAS
jgi:putative flippase GtrA